MSSRSAVVCDVRPQPLLLKHPPAVASSAAVEAIEFAEEVCGIYLDPWQRWVVELALSERADGSWSAFEVGIVCPRQNGKNFILEVVQIACIYLFGDQTLTHSAHKFDTSVEHFNRLKWIFENTAELADLLLPGDDSFVTSNGKEHIRFRTGQRILFKARYRGGGRGFTGDKVFLDEAYDLPAKAIGSLIPTLSTRPMAQVWYTSSAPHETSTVLHAVRQRAKADDGDDRLFYAEWGNEPDFEGDDLDAILRANPAVLAGHITEDYIRQEIRTFSGTPELVEEHRRERLGIASEPPSATESSIVAGDEWRALADTGSSISGRPCLALDVSPDRHWSSFGAAGRRSDGLLHVEVVDRRAGTAWVQARGVELFERWQEPIRIESGSPAAAFIAPLEKAGVKVEELSVPDHARALGQFLDAVAAGEVRHLGDPLLEASLLGAERRTSGDADRWARRSSRADITPLVAVTLAVGGVGDDDDVGFWNGED